MIGSDLRSTHSSSPEVAVLDFRGKREKRKKNNETTTGETQNRLEMKYTVQRFVLPFLIVSSHITVT